MRHVEVFARVRGLTCARVYAKICDFAEYPSYCPAVRSVDVIHTHDGRAISTWEVNFREGILRWKEEDVFNHRDHTVEFRQLQGDVDYFVGQWSVGETSDGCFVRFACDFDMGMPGLSDILEPIAEQALRENARSIIRGLIPSAEFPANNSMDAVMDTVGAI